MPRWAITTFYFFLGTIVSGISLLILPDLWFVDPSFRVANLVIAPLAMSEFPLLVGFIGTATMSIRMNTFSPELCSHSRWQLFALHMLIETKS